MKAATSFLLDALYFWLDLDIRQNFICVSHFTKVFSLQNCVSYGSVVMTFNRLRYLCPVIHLSKSPQPHVPASLPHHDGLCVWLVIAQGLVRGLLLQPRSWQLLVVIDLHRKQTRTAILTNSNSLLVPFTSCHGTTTFWLQVIMLRRLIGLTRREKD